MEQHSRFVGLDVHKDTIAVAIAPAGDGPPRSWGTIANDERAVTRLIRSLGPVDQLSCCYEAGPTGYTLQRHLAKLGVRCMVVAPSLIPTKPGDRVKTDRRDAEKLASLLRSGQLTGVWVPDATDEALRGLVRLRESIQRQRVRICQRIGKLLLRHGCQPPDGVRSWSARYRAGLAALRFEHSLLQEVLNELLEQLADAEARLARLDNRLAELAQHHPHAPIIQALCCLHGIGTLTAITLVAELGDPPRFPTPRHLMGYVGLGPREHSSGKRVLRGGVTKAGNHHVRWVIVESAWHQRRPPGTRARAHRSRRRQPTEVAAIAERADARLSRRFGRLLARGKPSQLVAMAVARELLGFVWAIGQQVPSRGVTEAPTVPQQQVA
ncbi:MAG: IS110 family transposase [Chloroflexota bacterium]